VAACAHFPYFHSDLKQQQAFAWISPVYVTAIKRGGGILLSSLLGVALFGETITGGGCRRSFAAVLA
jgi:hypothetical protein